MNIRDNVLKFALGMDDTLDKNSHKDIPNYRYSDMTPALSDGWKGCSDEYLGKKLLEEVAELFIILAPHLKDIAGELFKAEIRKAKVGDREEEAYDVANITFMAWDNSPPNEDEQT